MKLRKQHFDALMGMNQQVHDALQEVLDKIQTDNERRNLKQDTEFQTIWTTCEYSTQKKLIKYLKDIIGCHGITCDDSGYDFEEVYDSQDRRSQGQGK